MTAATMSHDPEDDHGCIRRQHRLPSSSSASLPTDRAALPKARDVSLFLLRRFVDTLDRSRTGSRRLEEVCSIRRLIVAEFMTLDGVMEAPGFDEHRSGRNAWALRTQADGRSAYNLGQLEAADAFLLGRTTYQIWAAFWPTSAGDDALADRIERASRSTSSRTRSSGPTGATPRSSRRHRRRGPPSSRRSRAAILLSTAARTWSTAAAARAGRRVPARSSSR